MKKLVQASKKFWKDESGVTAIEYGLIAALIALGIIAGATALGGKLSTLFTNIGNTLIPPAAN
ncbi:MAG: Flp family type IVb pilin [Betaproteobacteria bacterium]|jgi:pilus assembly protein Flp/PilA|nr:Flp family type IVb pilin [Betaproteobacteria bacterium]